MNQFKKKRKKSSKKRFFSPKIRTNDGRDTITVKFPDGTVKVVRPDMRYFDGDWKALALSVCDGHRVEWVIS